MKEISIKEIEKFAIGQAEDRAAGTGVTVVLCKEGAYGGLDVRGGGPASREGTLQYPIRWRSRARRGPAEEARPCR